MFLTARLCLTRAHLVPTVLANVKALEGSWIGFLSYASILRYFFELVMSNVLLGQFVTVSRRWAGDPTGPGGKHTPVSGHMIVHDYLGFNQGGTCARVIPLGDDPAGQISGCWYDLYVPLIWYVCAVLLSIVLLRFCVRDPH